MNNNHPLIKILAVLAFVGGLAACDGGSVGTSSNPNLSNSNTGFIYTGPAARDTDVSNFQFYLWRNVIDDSRCGGCHNSQASSPVSPMFFDTTDINLAYDQVMSMGPNAPYADLVNPAASRFVTKLQSGHFCWETVSAVCATLLQGWIDDWRNAANGGVSSRPINLVLPDSIRDPGDTKSFPVSHDVPAGTSFEETVYPLLVANPPFGSIANDNCQNCHEEVGPLLPQAPFFASGDVAAAYEAAKSKMDIDTPANSRFVLRLLEQHNCWNDCGTSATDAGSDANAMRQVIADFANGISETPIDPLLVTSKALTLNEGIVASGGNRHETDQFALWEFKTGSGLTAYDTSGLDPAVNLTLIGSVNWVGGYGLEFTGGRAQANTIDSDKLYTYIQTTGEYAIEAWVIPANVSQEDANIVSYSGGSAQRNFTLGQDMYNYDAYNRVDVFPPQPNGEPFLSSGANDEEIAQASLQHVVINYDPFTGREIYVNGQLVAVTDPVPSPTTINNVWDDSFAFILGNETSGTRPWRGQVKMVALHNRTLDPAQITQNFDVGVGQKFFLLFYVGHHLGETTPDPLNPIPNQDASFIMFEVAQFDSYSYLFNKPTFINLNPAWTPGSINIKGMRIGINGKQATAGQAFANMDVVVNNANYDSVDGQELASIGSIIALEKGPDSDEFFLTFEEIGAASHTFTDISGTIAADPPNPANPVASDIGVHTFEEIHYTIAAITGVPIDNSEVASIYSDYIQQLPAVEAIDAFLPSHQMAVAQLALTSCSELVENNGNIDRATYFPGFDFTDIPTVAFVDDTERAKIINPVMTAAMNVDFGPPVDNLTTQPTDADISAVLGGIGTQHLDGDLANASDDYQSLISQLMASGPNDANRTEQIAKAVCAAVTGAAVMIVQ